MTLQSLKVLVVEDEALVSMVIEEFLSELGCEVVATAAHVDVALAMANTLDIDVAMLDVNLAGTVSYPVALALRARAIPFFFATSYGLTGLPHDLNGVAVLDKPFGLEQLSDVLHRATRDLPVD
jgi:CheY-like chemotaxis protein